MVLIANAAAKTIPEQATRQQSALAFEKV